MLKCPLLARMHARKHCDTHQVHEAATEEGLAWRIGQCVIDDVMH